MTNVQKLTVRASEIRARLSELAEVAELTEEQRGELGTIRTEYRDCETKLQAAITAEGDAQPVPLGQGGTAEDRAYGDLCGRANIGAIFQALTERPCDRGGRSGVTEASQPGAAPSPARPVAGSRGTPGGHGGADEHGDHAGKSDPARLRHGRARLPGR